MVVDGLCAPQAREVPAVPRIDLGVYDRVEGELHVSGRERLPVVPRDTAAELERPGEEVAGNGPRSGQVGRRRRVLGVGAGQTVEHRLLSEERIERARRNDGIGTGVIDNGEAQSASL